MALHKGVQTVDDAVRGIHRAVGVAQQSGRLVGFLEPVVVGTVEAHIFVFEREVVGLEIVVAARREVGDAIVEVATPVTVVRRNG